MVNLFAKLCELIGGFGVGAATTACSLWLFDEPEMPKSLIEK